MAETPVPNPEDVEALGEAVNDVYRPLALQGKETEAQARAGIDLVPLASPRVIDALKVMEAYIADPGAYPDGVWLDLSCVDAGELVMLTAGLAINHQAINHPEDSWVGCSDQGRLVYYACQVFIQAIDHARQE